MRIRKAAGLCVYRPQIMSSDFQGQEKMDVPVKDITEFALPLPFCSIRA
jgi:hypothetical protein